MTTKTPDIKGKLRQTLTIHPFSGRIQECIDSDLRRAAADHIDSLEKKLAEANAGNREFPYHETFNAISAAVTWRENNTLEISVKVFQDSFNKAIRHKRCDSCGGRGIIGGFVNAESGYEDHPCPDCNKENQHG